MCKLIFRLNPSSLLGWCFYTSPWRTFLNNFWNSQRFDMKFWQCILNLICHHLSKFAVTIDKMTSLKMTYCLDGYFLTLVHELIFYSNFASLNLVILIQNLGVPFCNLSQVWILQTRLIVRPKSYFDTIGRTLNFKFVQKVHFVTLVNNFDFWQFLLIPHCKMHISSWSIPAIPYFKKQKCFWLKTLTSDRF